MAELTPKERLQPSLLDRLTDDEPDKQVESRQKRVLSLNQLRQSVLRDLAWLFNVGNLGEVQDLDRYPYAATSVLNFGLPELTGCTVSSVDAHELERVVRQAILTFEPRILPNSVRVQVLVSDDASSRNSLTFEITGELWARPLPERLFLKTQLDLESGDFTVDEYVDRGSR